MKKLLTLLVLEPHDKPIYLVLRDEGSIEDKEYFYNEHTCPTNYISQTEVIIDGDDYDPHGIFQYVGSIAINDDFDFNDHKQVSKVIEALVRKAKPKDGI